MARVHTSPYAGAWYPAGENELRSLLETAMESSHARTGLELVPNALAFVVPHAGLMYSGTVACAAYRYMKVCRPRRIVLLGFSHHGGPAGVAIPDIEVFRTPLGETRLDSEALEFLRSQPQFQRVEEELVCDHSVEIQLPLLQYAAPEAKLVPLYVGSMSATERDAAARALAQLADAGTIFVASSDLTHFGRAFGFQPFAADDQAATKLAELDRGVIEDAGSLDAEMFLAGLRRSGSPVCGRDPIALLLRTLSTLDGDEIFQETLDYQTSGELTGDFTHCVSYAALGYFPASSFRLSPADADQLLSVTRRTLAQFLRDGTQDGSPPKLTPALRRRQGAFVTLHEGGKMRGCVGKEASRGHLQLTVPGMAISAATEDPRFAPIQPGFAGELEIEITLLTPVKRVPSRDSFRLHEHGAWLESGERRSLLLPQISRERRWSADQFWQALARKASLPISVYEEPRTSLYLFRAQVIP
jgi:AmmeMemoRadiSam system protein B/AmmeMemoRadiSam system protein A